MQNISEHQDWFTDFVAHFLAAEKEDTSLLQLKFVHTEKVLEHARRLADEEETLRPLARSVVLAALYHDVARFPQFARWRTFKDSQSINHGLLGVKILKQHNRFAAEKAEIRHIVLAAVGMHNRFVLPEGLPPAVRLVTEALRDADKLDILRIMAQHFSGQNHCGNAVVLHVADEPMCWTPKVAEAVLQGRVASYADLQYANDFKLLLGTWLRELHFAATRHALVQQGYLTSILQDLPDAPQIAAARACIERDLARIGQ